MTAAFRFRETTDEMIVPVVELLRSEQDRQEMSLAARQQGLTLDWPQSAAKMRALYDRIGR